MKILNTKHKQKSAVITAVLLLLLLFGVFNFGMKYLDPPIEYGVAINFGNSDVGSGEPVEKTKQSQQTEEEVVEEQQEEASEEKIEEKQEEVKEAVQEDVITNDAAKDVPVVKETKKETKAKEVKETPKKESKPKAKPKPKPSKETMDALNSLMNGNSSEGSNKGEGDDKKSGVKGKENGDPKSSKYYGNSGSGSGGNYNLAGRKALSKPVKQPDCQEEGTVVVNIFVNQNGKVIKAIPGAKGTTNSAPCLFKAAKDAAMATKWNADGEAPSQQKGTIIYKFSLSK